MMCPNCRYGVFEAGPTRKDTSSAQSKNKGMFGKIQKLESDGRTRDEIKQLIKPPTSLDIFCLSNY